MVSPKEGVKREGKWQLTETLDAGGNGLTNVGAVNTDELSAVSELTPPEAPFRWKTEYLASDQEDGMSADFGSPHLTVDSLPEHDAFVVKWLYNGRGSGTNYVGIRVNNASDAIYTNSRAADATEWHISGGIYNASIGTAILPGRTQPNTDSFYTYAISGRSKILSQFQLTDNSVYPVTRIDLSRVGSGGGHAEMHVYGVDYDY